MLKYIIRALRLPFILASVLPFIFGSLVERNAFNFLLFLLGLITAAATHLSANLINDYADSKSGADAQDKKYYKFFGGSKLIQEGVFSAKFYFNFAVLLGLVALVSVLLLGLILSSLKPVFFYLLIIFLGWSYSCKPLQFSYRKMGELIIFLLFGPAVVMGAYYIQTQIFPDFKSFLLSIPFGLLTCAILFVNEVPDLPEDKNAGKMTWVSLSGPGKAYLVYLLLILTAFLAIVLCVIRGYLSILVLFCLLLFPLVLKAAGILKHYHSDKSKLIASSKITIVLHMLVSIILIIFVLL